MFDILDPRDDSRDRERDDDRIRDREDHWLELGRDLESATDRDDLTVNRDPDRDRYGLERDREPRDRDDDRSSMDPRDVFMRDLELPLAEERELVRDRDLEYSLSVRDAHAVHGRGVSDCGRTRSARLA